MPTPTGYRSPRSNQRRRRPVRRPVPRPAPRYTLPRTTRTDVTSGQGYRKPKPKPRPKRAPGATSLAKALAPRAQGRVKARVRGGGGVGGAYSELRGLSTGLLTTAMPLTSVAEPLFTSSKARSETAKGVRDLPAGIVAGIPYAVSHPGETFEALKRDYARRYGALARGDTRAIRRMMEEEGSGGAVPWALDAAIAGPGASLAAGRLARTGKLGKRAERLMREPRPDLRFSGGEGGRKPQRASDRLLQRRAQARRDESRRRVYERRVRKAGTEGYRPAVQPRRGEVVARGGVELGRSGRVVSVPGRLRTDQRLQRKRPAREKGRSRIEMLQEQVGVERAFGTAVDRRHGRRLGNLSGPERRAFRYVYGGLIDSASPARALAQVRERIAAVEAEAASQGTRVPGPRRETNDELRTLRRVESDLASGVPVVTARLAQAARDVRRLEVRVEAGNPTHRKVPEAGRVSQAQKRRYMPQAETLERAGKLPPRLDAKEKWGSYVDRVGLRAIIRAAQGEGLERPGYFPSEKRFRPQFSVRAVGGGRGLTDDKSYTGALFRTGREDVRPEVLLNALFRGVKRRHNVNLIARTAEEHALDVPRVTRPAERQMARPIKELVDDLEHAQINPADVAFFSPGRVFAQLRDQPERTEVGELPEQGSAQLAKAVQGARVDAIEARNLVDDQAFAKETGWLAVPKAVMDEIESGAIPEGLAARLFDITKGKFSRTLLGLGNVSWLAFQVGSNALLTGIFQRVGPGAAIRAQMWWKDLSQEQRDAIRPLLGVSSHHSDFDRKRLGATAANSSLVNAKRGLEQTAAWRTARRYNIIDAFFRADAKQNEVFRRTVLHSEARRAAFRDMGSQAGQIIRLQDRVERTLTKRGDARAMVNSYLSDRRTLERHAERVDELLGDYLTFTRNERKYMNRYVMFYGFMRHSLRLAFWTLPTRHPVTTAILGKLALLGAQESREILGGEQLPWGLGKVYWRSGGRVMEIDLARMNPATNALIDIRSAEQVTRFLPPFVSMAVEQAAEKSMFTGKPWLVGGRTQGLPNPAEPFRDYSLMDHIRVAAAQLSTTVPPVRYLEKVTFEGPQGDDASLVFGPAPTGYKRPDITRSIAESVARVRAKGTGQRALEAVLPFLPRESEDPRIARSRAERRAQSEGRSSSGPVDWSKVRIPKGGAAIDWSKVKIR